MLSAVRINFPQYSKRIACVYSCQYSTKVSNAVIKDPSSDSDEPHFNKSNKRSVHVIPLINTKEPLCTPAPLNTTSEWELITTDWKNTPFMYLRLSKIRLTSLVVITTMAGYAVATAPFYPGSFLCCCIGTGLVSSAANTINQYHEVPFDAQMSRTKNRVLVKAQLSSLHALTFAFLAGTSGLSILYFGCNGLTAILGISNLILYTCIYTPLKRMSILNTWVGSIVGAIPPVMGWVSCSGNMDSGAWLLAAILYAWQFPHFNALSWNLRPDYSRAGYRMMAVTNPGLCRRTALRYTAAITLLSGLAPICDITNDFFLIQTLPLNLYFTYLAFRFYKESDSTSSRKLFRFSLIHLPLLIVLMLVNKKHWYIKNGSEKSSVNESNTIVETHASKPLDTSMTGRGLLIASL